MTVESQKTRHVARLKRAVGQMQGVMAMIEGEVPTKSVAMQLRAAERALAETRKAIVQEQIDVYLDERFSRRGEPPRAVSENVKDLSKYL